MKRMKKKVALDIALKFFNRNVTHYVEFVNGIIESEYFDGCGQLCNALDELNFDWKEYWDEINDEHHTVMIDYFNHLSSREEDTILRLLVLHQFINETYED